MINQVSKSITLILLLISLVSSLNATEPDTIFIKNCIEQAEELEFIDVLKSRELTHKAYQALGRKMLKVEDINNNKYSDAFLKLQGKMMFVHAKSHYWMGQYEASKHLYDHSIAAIQKVDENSLLIAEGLVRQAIILSKMGEVQIALENILKASKIYASKGMELEIAWCNAVRGGMLLYSG